MPAHHLLATYYLEDQQGTGWPQRSTLLYPTPLKPGMCPPVAPPAAGEEEDQDTEWPLGAVEKAPASLRAPGAGVVSSFQSDRQKHETVSPDSILTKIVMGALRVLGWKGEGVGVGDNSCDGLIALT